MIDAWSDPSNPPTPQQFPRSYGPNDGITKLLDKIRAIETQLRDVRSHLPGSGITTPMLADAAITSPKIGPGAVTAPALADGSVGYAALTADAIDGKVITGAIIRTAAIGNRWEMNGVDFVDRVSGHTGSVNEAYPASLQVTSDGVELAAALSGPQSTITGYAASVRLNCSVVAGVGTSINIGADKVQISGALILGLSVYANNADAITGGLAVGSLYRDGADPDLVCIVH